MSKFLRLLPLIITLGAFAFTLLFTIATVQISNGNYCGWANRTATWVANDVIGSDTTDLCVSFGSHG